MATGGWLQRCLEKYVFNPSARLALRLGIAPRAFALLETTGRHSGQRHIRVGDEVLDVVAAGPVFGDHPKHVTVETDADGG